MHIAARPDVVPAAAQPYHLALKHNGFCEARNQELIRLDAGIICKKACPHWQAPIVAVKKHTPEGLHHSSSHLCIDYRKLKLLVTGSHTSSQVPRRAFSHLCPYQKMMSYLLYSKGAKYFTALDLCSGYYHITIG